MRRTLSAVILVIMLCLAAVFYSIMFTRFSFTTYEFLPIFYLSAGSFLIALGIIVSALLIEKKDDKKQQ